MLCFHRIHTHTHTHTHIHTQSRSNGPELNNSHLIWPTANLGCRFTIQWTTNIMYFICGVVLYSINDLIGIVKCKHDHVASTLAKCVTNTDSIHIAIAFRLHYIYQCIKLMIQRINRFLYSSNGIEWWPGRLIMALIGCNPFLFSSLSLSLSLSLSSLFVCFWPMAYWITRRCVCLCVHNGFGQRLWNGDWIASILKTRSSSIGQTLK